MTDPLRIIAVSAPEHEAGGMPAEKIYSRDPASLFNAMRVAAMETKNPRSAWVHSNFAGSRKERREKLLLMHSLDNMPMFEALLRKEKPHIVFLGAMTLAMPGAVECAKKAREILGDDVLIVLGGKHPSETMYRDNSGLIQLGGKPAPIQHHPGSPLKLMQDGKLPQGLFDIVVSGYAEHVVAKLGEAADQARKAGNIRNFAAHLGGIENAPGDWVLGYNDHGQIRTIPSKNIPIDYNKLASPTTLFGVSTAFDVFDGKPTAHVYSDIGMGCVYSCGFCSEAADVVGKPIDLANAPERLYQQLKDARDVIHTDHGKPASAFCEDSVFLGGDPKLINRFCDLMEKHPIDIAFGAQFTIDQITRNKDLIKRLQKVGLSYVFMGIETYDPKEIGGMSKSTGGSRGEWMDRTRDAVSFLHSTGLKSGAAVLFGLGESHQSRLKLLDAIEELQQLSPTALRPVSANLAVQHPLKGHDNGANYDYLKWGTAKDSPYNGHFHHFGEASEHYPIKGIATPSMAEIGELCVRLEQLNNNAPKVRLEQGYIYPPYIEKMPRSGALSVIAATQVGFPSLAAYNQAAAHEGSPLHYGNLGTPTDKKLAATVAEMEGGKHGILTPSGHAAMAHTLGGLLKSGDHVLVVDSAIFSTKQYFCDSTLRKMGVDVEYYDPAKGDDIKAHIKSNTKLIYMESPAAYTHEIQQIDQITKAAKARGILTVMDNTWSASTFFKPFEHGVDVSVVSLGKYHFGPAGIPMGAIVTANRNLHQDLKAYSLSWGNRVSAHDAGFGWKALQTLEERLRKQQESAEDVAHFLETRPEVKSVMHPTLGSSPQHATWKADFTGASSLVPVEFRDDLPKGYSHSFQDALAEQGMVSVGDGYGGSFSLVRGFDAHKWRNVTPPKETGECVRLYVGHEAPQDIKTHIERALEKANRKHGL